MPRELIDADDIRRALALQKKQDDGERLTAEEKAWLRATIQKYGG